MTFAEAVFVILVTALTLGGLIAIEWVRKLPKVYKAAEPTRERERTKEGANRKRYIAIGAAFLGLAAVLYLVLTITVMNKPPEAVILGVYAGGLTIEFNGTESKDSGPPPWVGLRRYQWEFGDGKTSTEAKPNHTYPSSGEYTVTLEVTDWGGATDQAKVLIIIGDEIEEAFLNSESSREFWVVGEEHKNIGFQEWLAEVIDKQDVDLVALEGMTSPIEGLSYYRDLARTDPRVAELLKKIARELLSRNIIDGTEYYAIIKVIEGGEPEFVGVEDHELLKEHIDFYTGQPYRQAQNEFSNTLAKLVAEDLYNILSHEKYSDLLADLKELQRESERYKRGEISPPDYRNWLIQKLKDIGQKELERRLFQEIVVDERTISLTPNERERALSLLRSIFQERRILPADPKVIGSLEYYLGFALRVEAEEKIKTGWVWKQVEKEIQALMKEIKSKADHYAKGEISLRDYYSFIRSKLEEYGLNISSLEKAHKELDQFESKSMELIIKRNGSMIENAINASKQGDKIFLVVGKTHLADLIRRLKEEGYSYYVLSPDEDFGSSPDEQRDYFEHFFEFGPSFEEMLKGRIKTPWRINKPEMKEQIWTQLKVTLATLLLKEGKSPEEIEREIENLNLPPPDHRPDTRVEEIDYPSMSQFGINIYLALKLSDGGIALGKATSDPERPYAEWVRLRWDESISREEIKVLQEALLRRHENKSKMAKLIEALLMQRDKALPDELVDKGVSGQPRSAAMMLELSLSEYPEDYAYVMVANGILKAANKGQYMGQGLNKEEISEWFSVDHQVTSEDYPQSLMKRYYGWYYENLEIEARLLEAEEGREKESERLRGYIQEVKDRILNELSRLNLTPGNTIHIPGVWIRDPDGREIVLPPTPDGFVLIDASIPLLEYLSELVPPEAILIGITPDSVAGDLDWKMAETIKTKEITVFVGRPVYEEGEFVDEEFQKAIEDLRRKGPFNFKDLKGMSKDRFISEIERSRGPVIVLGHIPKTGGSISWPGPEGEKIEIEKEELKKLAKGKVFFGLMSCFAAKVSFLISVVEGKAILSFGPFKELDGRKVLNALQKIAEVFREEETDLKRFFSTMMIILRVTGVQEESPIIINIDMEMPAWPTAPIDQVVSLDLKGG